jgi:hypothetical protein
MPRELAALLMLAALCAVVRGDDALGALPCGVLEPVDALLCSSAAQSNPTPGPAAPQPEASPEPRAGAAGAAGTSDGDVRRVGPRSGLVPDLLLVRFVARARAERRAAVLADAGATEERTIRPLGVTVARVEPRRLEEARATLEQSRWVKSVERDVVVHALGGPRPSAWTSHHAWNFARPPEAASTLVAVIDTGVDPSHPDLAGAIAPGYDFVNDDQDPSDDHWHGTAVAGVVAGRTSQATGTCPRCMVMPVKVLGADGLGSTSSVAAGIVYAVDQGARVINVSLGGPDTSQLLADAVTYAASRNVLLVAAAGNEGVSTPFYPAAHAPALSVAGATAADQLYPWSNFGEWVAVAARGCRPAPVHGGYAEFCGTSAAAPVVAGVAGRILESRPALAASEIAEALEGTAQPIGAVVRFGRIREDEALAALVPARATRSATFRGTLQPRRQVRVFAGDVGAGPFRATLRFTGSSRLTIALVDALGATIVRGSGRSPIKLSGTLSAASYGIVVSGARVGTRYTLVVTHA